MPAEAGSSCPAWSRCRAALQRSYPQRPYKHRIGFKTAEQSEKLCPGESPERGDLPTVDTQLADSFVHRQYLRDMHWLTRLLMQKRHIEALDSDLTDARNRVHRLEIALREIRDRLDTVEGSHASLSASVRGRLGGRPPKAPAALQAPLGMVFPFNRQE